MEMMPRYRRGPGSIFERPEELREVPATARDPAEQAAAEAILAETRGLYAQPIDPNRRIDDPSNWDRRSHRQLTGARRSMGMISERNPRIERLDGSRSRNPLEARQWHEAVSAARIRNSTDIPREAAWFNIRNADIQSRPPRRIEALGRVRYWGSYGPFVNVGGGDVRPGRNVMIDIYVLEDE